MSKWESRNLIDRKRWGLLRQIILDRDGHRCRSCGRPGRLEVDHVRPIQDGGDKYNPANLQLLCRHCHHDKTRSENLARSETKPAPGVEAWDELVQILME